MRVKENLTYDSIFGIRVEQYKIDRGENWSPRYEYKYIFYDGYTKLEPIDRYKYHTDYVYKLLKSARTAEEAERLFTNMKHKFIRRR